MKKILGFSLIELLIVIAIIGILATVVMTNVQGVRSRARDYRRKTDLASLQKSLRLYYNDASKYPSSTVTFQIMGCGTLTTPTACSWDSPFATSLATYMSKLPLDPGTSATNQITYRYYRPSNNTDQYILVSSLENLSDADIEISQARCSAMYNAFGTTGGGTKNITKDYVICPE